MSEMQVFKSDEFGQVRTVQRDGEPWFVAADVCRALEIDPTATRRIDDDEKSALRLTQTSSNGVEQERDVSIVNEPGLYALVLGSRKPEAKAFKRWITHEVLPTIRRHGAYATDDTIEKILGDPDFGIRLLGELKQEREARRAMEAQNAMLLEDNKAMQPKALFADAVSVSKTCILVGELAKLLKQNGVEIGQKRMFEELRKRGYLVKRKGSEYNMPTQKSMELGLFEIRETCITHADGHTSISKTPKVTGKGQVYFVDLFLRKAN